MADKPKSPTRPIEVPNKPDPSPIKEPGKIPEIGDPADNPNDKPKPIKAANADEQRI